MVGIFSKNRVYHNSSTDTNFVNFIFEAQSYPCVIEYDSVSTILFKNNYNDQFLWRCSLSNQIVNTFGGSKHNQIVMGWFCLDSDYTRFKQASIKVSDHLSTYDVLNPDSPYSFLHTIYTTNKHLKYYLCNIPNRLGNRSDQYIIPSLNSNKNFVPIITKNYHLVERATISLRSALLRQALLDNSIKSYCQYEAPTHPKIFSLNSVQGTLLLKHYALSININLVQLQNELHTNPLKFREDTNAAWLLAANHHNEEWYNEFWPKDDKLL